MRSWEVNYLQRTGMKNRQAPEPKVPEPKSPETVTKREKKALRTSDSREYHSTHPPAPALLDGAHSHSLGDLFLLPHLYYKSVSHSSMFNTTNPKTCEALYSYYSGSHLYRPACREFLPLPILRWTEQNLCPQESSVSSALLCLLTNT